MKTILPVADWSTRRAKTGRGLTARTRVVGLDGAELPTHANRVDARANRVTVLPIVPLTGLFAANPMVLVQLRLTDAAGLVSENFYWRGRDEAAYRWLNEMATVPLSLEAAAPVTDGKDRLVRVTLANRSASPALAAKLTLVDAAGERILPAFYSDNFVSLLPGETRIVDVRYPAGIAGAPSVRLRGWNVREAAAVAR